MSLQATGPGLLLLSLDNVGAEPLDVRSHVAAAGEVHLDWFTLRLEAAGGQWTQVRLWDARDRSAPITVRLAPGESVRHTVDVAAWAARPINGGHAPAPGAYRAHVTYDVGPDEHAWQGHLECGPVTLELPTL